MAQQAPQILTANRLDSGQVVYWRAGAWVFDAGEAELLVTEPEAEAALAAAAASVAANLVVNPYLFALRPDEARLEPVKERERIRAGGPSVRSDFLRATDVPL